MRKKNRKQNALIALVVALVLALVMLMFIMSQQSLRHSDEVIARADRILAEYGK